MIEIHIRHDVHIHNGGDPVSAKLDLFGASLNAISGAQTHMATTMKEVLDDLDQIKKQAGDYIAGRDAIDTQLRADLAAATAAAGISPAEQADIDAAFAKAQEAKALLAAPATATTGVTNADPI